MRRAIARMSGALFGNQNSLLKLGLLQEWHVSILIRPLLLLFSIRLSQMKTQATFLALGCLSLVQAQLSQNKTLFARDGFMHLNEDDVESWSPVSVGLALDRKPAHSLFARAASYFHPRQLGQSRDILGQSFPVVLNVDDQTKKMKLPDDFSSFARRVAVAPRSLRQYFDKRGPSHRGRPHHIKAVKKTHHEGRPGRRQPPKHRAEKHKAKKHQAARHGRKGKKGAPPLANQLSKDLPIKQTMSSTITWCTLLCLLETN
jgi:hypothetical protein